MSVFDAFKRKVMGPQPGPQTEFSACTADIAIIGGSGGGGKSRSLVDEAAKWVGVPGYSAVMFRRTFPDIRRPGGLKDATQEVFPLFGGKLREDYMTWTFPARTTVQLAHLQHEKDIYDWKGSEVPLICVAEGTPVMMADGSYLSIESIVAGDHVMTLEGPKRVNRTFAPRLAACVRAEVLDANGFVMATQEHPEDHAILTNEGWIAYSLVDRACDRASASPATRYHSPRRSASRLERRSPPSRPSPGTRPLDRPPLFEPSRSSPDRWGRMADDAWSGDGENDGAASCARIRDDPRPPSLIVQARLHGPCHPSLGTTSSRDPREHGGPCARTCSPSAASSSDRGCLPCFDPGGGPLPRPSRNARSCPRPATSADGRSRSCSLADARDNARTRSPAAWSERYVHPYTMEDRLASEPSGFRACAMTPVGERRVYDISVQDANHYVTAGGFVNKNCWDELTSFTRTQFFYLLSRNRSKCGVKPYIRASTNPDAESWVADLIAWWWDPETGYAIPERSGVIRWFVQDPKGGGLIWADTREELVAKDADAEPLSFTFIRSKLEDNKILMAADPAYRSKLKGLDPVERARLLDGNWLIKPAPGLYFQLHWCEFVDDDQLPAYMDWCRGWDRAATPKTPENDPDWTVGVRIGRDPYGNFYVDGAVRMRDSAMKVEQAIKNTAVLDDAGNVRTRVQLAQDPAQAGKGEAEHMLRFLVGHDVHADREGGDKLVRFKAFSAQAEAGNVKIVRRKDPAQNAWIGPWAANLEQFPPSKGGHDDDVDATSTAFNALVTMPSIALLVRMGGG